MQTVVVLGAMGMAGHLIVSHLRRVGAYNVLGIARSKGLFVDEVLDVTHFKSLASYLTQVKADYVINCVGVLVDHAKQENASAILLNSYLPHYLAKTGKRLGFKLIHISTDCVFSGKDGGYLESSFRDGDGIYARSKALGEVINDRDLTIRTSIIGPELKKNGTGLFDFFLKQNGAIKGFSKAFWSGVTTLELAKAVEWAVSSDIHGLYHVTNGQPINKYDLLMLFKKHTGYKIDIKTVDGQVTNKSLVDTRQEIAHPIPSYDMMIENMVEWMKQNPHLYTQYGLKA